MSYKPVQNESAHLTDKPGRPAFKAKKLRQKKRGMKETAQMAKPMAYERAGKKTRS